MEPGEGIRPIENHRPERVFQPVPYSKTITAEDLINVNAHLGHKRGMWNPKMKPYLFGTSRDVHIIDLDQTAAMMNRALAVARGIGANDGLVVFIDTRPELERVVRRAALSCEEYYISRNFMRGAFSNCWQMLGTSRRPDLVICTFMPQAGEALEEAAHCDIPTIGLVDSDCDPSAVMYAVPANDDTPSTVEFFLGHFAAAVREGKAAKYLL